ncbi:MAG: AmmeMemoRadiSam system protein A [Candidatus Binatia bacterium]
MSPDPPTFLPLTAAEQRELLWLARQSIRTALDGETPPACATITPALNEPAGVFVSLHRDGRLRGCIGAVTAERPLYQAVARMAVSAAFDDPRFPPLTKAELPATAIEISRLSRLTPGPAEHICPGRHGVYLKHREQCGVFLPQVALEYRWDRETLLSELCRKAMLPRDAWKHPETTLMLFEADVFSEKDAYGSQADGTQGIAPGAAPGKRTP